MVVGARRPARRAESSEKEGWKKLNRALTAPGCDVLAVCAVSLADFNEVNVATAVHRLGRQGRAVSDDDPRLSAIQRSRRAFLRRILKAGGDWCLGVRTLIEECAGTSRREERCGRMDRCQIGLWKHEISRVTRKRSKGK